MSTSPLPSPSPRRMHRPQQHASPLATRHRTRNDEDCDVNVDASSYRPPAAAAPTPTTKHAYGRGGDRGGFYQISLTDGQQQPQQQQLPPKPAVDPSSSYQGTPPTHAHVRAQSYSQGDDRYDRYDRSNDNYGYRPSYALSSAASSSASHTRKLSTGALRPVQEYHNAFANGEDPYTASTTSALLGDKVLPPPPSASDASEPAHSLTPSASSSHFATFSSASRAFLAHRRQQSIPNLLPSIQSIGRNLGRALSPDRSLRSSQPSRPPIPVYQDGRGTSGRRQRDEIDDDSESPSSDEYSDSDSDDDDDDDDGDGDDDRYQHGGGMAFTGDARAPRRDGNAYASYKSGDNNSNKLKTSAPSVASGFSHWLTGSVKAASADRAASLASLRTTTPEPSNRPLRGSSPAGRSMSIASDASATPRSSIVAAASATTSPSRFSQLATSMTATLSRLAQHPSPASPRALGASFENDEFYNLDVDAALFPTGHPSDRDPFSPSAYKNLEANALGALRHMQAAYRQRAVAHHELAVEKSARDEELEEAETRAQHLKMQLEGMARRAAEQQKEMQLLMDELAAEKKARAQERAMLLAGAPTTPTTTPTSTSTATATATATASTASTIVSEDLGVDEAQRDHNRRKSASWRRRSLKSDGSSYEDMDSDEEEEEASSAVDEDERSNGSSSVFSRSRSPTLTPGLSWSLDSTAGEAQPHVAHPRVAALGAGAARLPSRSVSTASTATVVSQFPNQPLSTFQKLVKNVTAAINNEEPDRFTTSTCRNCRGEDVSFAWDTVSVLRDENKHLKQRVGQLEVAVEGALDMVNGVGL